MKLINLIDKHKIATIVTTLGIPKTTLYRWLNHQSIESHIKFIELLKYLDVDIDEFIVSYKKSHK